MISAITHCFTILLRAQQYKPILTRRGLQMIVKSSSNCKSGDRRTSNILENHVGNLAAFPTEINCQNSQMSPKKYYFLNSRSFQRQQEDGFPVLPVLHHNMVSMSNARITTEKNSFHPPTKIRVIKDERKAEKPVITAPVIDLPENGDP